MMPGQDPFDAEDDAPVEPGQADAAGTDALPGVARANDGADAMGETESNPSALAPPISAPYQPRASFAPSAAPPPRINDAMRVLSRMQIDLDIATGGKRAATYEEVDTAFDNSIKALGIRLPSAGSGEGEAVPAAQMPGAATRGAGVSAGTRGDSLSAFAVSGGKEAGVAGAATPSLSGTAAAPSGDTAPAEAPAQAGPGAAAPNSAANLRREWPVPIPSTGLHLPLRGEQDSRGKYYSNGQFSLTGAYRTQNGKPHKHEGDDVPDPLDTPVKAAADGVVTFVGTEWKMVQAVDPKTHKPLWKMDGKKRRPVMVKAMAGYGHYVKILHPDGYETLYGHLRDVPPLKQGMAVKLGQEIGHLGETGNAAGGGSHVHFGVRDSRMGTWVDPAKWIAGDLGIAGARGAAPARH